MLKLQVKGSLKHGKTSFLQEFYLKRFPTYLVYPLNLRMSSYTGKHYIGWMSLTYSYKESLEYYNRCPKRVLMDQHFSLYLQILSGYTLFHYGKPLKLLL